MAHEYYSNGSQAFLIAQDEYQQIMEHTNIAYVYIHVWHEAWLMQKN
jgi:hypothetical protein